jgi:hypothetical protein
MKSWQLNRRSFLRGGAVTLALPLLESWRCAGAAEAATPAPRRMLAICTMLGIHIPNLVPRETGANFALTPYLECMRTLRDQLTVFSGLSHPDVDGGHNSEACYLTAAPHPGAPSFRNTISLDQYAIERLPAATRFPSLVLSARGGTISFTRSGVSIPSEFRPATIYTRLFVNGTAGQVAAQVRRLQDGQSVLDTVGDPARRLQARVGAADRERLDQYFTAVREVENRMRANQEWARRPKPRVNYPMPGELANPADNNARIKILFDLIHLAFQTDSTRVITLHLSGGTMVPPIEGVTLDAHNLSHHGQDPEKLAQLRLVEAKQMETVAEFLTRMKQTNEGSETLLDRTSVLYGSNLGNASSHNTRNLPIILAGGGFRHGRHLGFDTQHNTPLCRLYVSMLQRLGIETDQFATGRGTLPGLEIAR